MKKAQIPAIIILILSLLLAIGSQTFLGPCVHEDGTFGPCHWAGRSLLGLGLLTGILAALLLCFPRLRMGIYVSMLPVCILGILTPGPLIRLCAMPAMRCRMIMQPATILLFSAALLCAAVGAFLSARKS